MSNENNIAPINEDLNVVKYEVEEIKQKIYTIRGKQVMLDRDLAMEFEVETKRINESVKGRGQHRKYLPYDKKFEEIFNQFQINVNVKLYYQN